MAPITHHGCLKWKSRTRDWVRTGQGGQRSKNTTATTNEREKKINREKINVYVYKCPKISVGVCNYMARPAPKNDDKRGNESPQIIGVLIKTCAEMWEMLKTISLSNLYLTTMLRISFSFARVGVVNNM